MGCFNILGTNPLKVVSMWMELSFCKQLCIGKNYEYAGIQDFSCYCFSHSELSRMGNLSVADCSIPCPGNTYQDCGTGYSVNVYSTG